MDTKPGTLSQVGIGPRRWRFGRLSESILYLAIPYYSL